MKHTPTPWNFVVADNANPPRCIIMANEGEHQLGFLIGAEPEDQANAEHIVKCVNAHDELVELCEQSLRALHEDDFPHLRERLRNALKGVTE